MIAVPKVITPKNTVSTPIYYVPTALKLVYPFDKMLVFLLHNIQNAIMELYTADLETNAYPEDLSPPQRFNYHP